MHMRMYMTCCIRATDADTDPVRTTWQIMQPSPRFSCSALNLDRRRSNDTKNCAVLCTQMHPKLGIDKKETWNVGLQIWNAGLLI